MLKYWQMESHTANRLTDTISTELFWFACDMVSPIETGICLMFRNMALIVAVLFMVLSSIVFFENTYNLSTVVSTIAVFLSGDILGLFFECFMNENHFIGWAEIKAKRELETAVKQFQQGRSNVRNLNRGRLVGRIEGCDPPLKLIIGVLLFLR